MNSAENDACVIALMVAKKPAMAGTVTHPDDLQPAIDALTNKGKMWLDAYTQGREITPRDLALAGDFEREELTHV